MKYKENVTLSRKWQSNPYHDSSLISRLSQIEAIDLRENFYVKEINNSYDEILPVDMGKKFKGNLI